MTKRSEISSTEKLLDVIRSDAPTSIDIAPNTSSNKATLPKKSFSVTTSGRSGLIVGVDIGYNDIKLIKVQATSDKNFSLLEYATIPFGGNISRTNDNFPPFLRRTLQNFVGSTGKVAIWSTISSAEVEVKPLLVPKVAKKQLANTVFWTFKKDTPINERLSVFDFEVQGETTDKGVKKTAVLAYTAPKKDISEQKDLFSKSGYPLSGITIAPFALQNLFRTNWIAADANQVICHLYIGRDWSRIDIFSHGQLTLIRGIKTGVHSMAEELIEAIKEGKDTSSISTEISPDTSPNTSIDTKEISFTLEDEEPPAAAESTPMEPEQPPTLEEACRILYSLNAEATPLASHEPGATLSESEIFEMIQPAVERLLRQIERTFDHYVSVSSGSPIQKVYISGKVDTYDHLVKHISAQLGQPCSTIDPFAATPTAQKGFSKPRTVAERISYTLAMGLALSHNDRTPNFLFTNQDKNLQARVALFERGAFITFLVAALICGGMFFWQVLDGNAKDKKLARLNSEISKYSMVLDENFITQLAQRVKTKKERVRKYSQRYLAMAAINELTLRTPENISLVSTSYTAERPEPMDIPQNPKPGKPKTLQKAKQHKNMVINGMISGDRQLLDSDLASYLVKLAGSPLFGQPTILKSSIDTFEGKVVLNFTLSLELL